ncbi:MAG TPA: DUF1820 family protein [Vicinamibacteria bacterium]|nr:DUF1820 family protein [Vicinamibacteria bacterium]
MPDKKTQRIYKVTFYNQGEVYEIYARKVTQGGLFGFVEIEELVFGEKSTVVIDPSQERLEREFEGVNRTYVPLHAVVRIDEVQKGGSGRITTPKDGEGKVRPFPTLLPRGGPGK